MVQGGVSGSKHVTYGSLPIVGNPPLTQLVPTKIECETEMPFSSHTVYVHRGPVLGAYFVAILPR